MRKRNSNVNGNKWTQAEINAVWQNGIIVSGYDPAEYRKDCCGTWIEYSKYGKNIEGDCCWEIDHIRPVSSGGSDDISNLQPLQWQNNQTKGDDWPNWQCFYGSK